MPRRPKPPVPVPESPPVAATPAPADADPATGRPAAFAVRADSLAGVTLLEDRRFRQVQLRFADKPPEAVRTLVRDAGFQWRSAEGVWTKQLDPDHAWRTRADADRLFAHVADHLRAIAGTGPAVG